MLFICLVEFVYTFIHLTEGAVVYYVHMLSPVIKFISLILCIALLLSHRKYGRTSSGLLFCYWFIVCLLGLPQFGTDYYAYEYDFELPGLRITYMVYYCLCLIMCILNFTADNPPLVSRYYSPEKPCPENFSSFPSWLTYFWFDKLIYLGFKRPLVYRDVWNLDFSLLTRTISIQFDYYWNKAIANHNKYHCNHFHVINGKNNKKPGKRAKNEGYAKVSMKGDSQNCTNQPSIVGPIFRAFSLTFLSGSLLGLIADLMAFLSPQLLRLIIKLIEEKQPMWKGYFYAVCLFTNYTLVSLIHSQYTQKMFLVGLQARSSIMSAIYRKALRISSSKMESTLGETINLMAVDAQKVMDGTTNINVMFSGSVQITLAIYFLWEILGPSTLSGLVVILIILPLNGYVAGKFESFQRKQMTCKDSRIKFMNEILSGIKILKLYAWEQCFIQKVLEIRNIEVKHIRSCILLFSVSSFFWACTPIMVSLASFATFVLSSDKNILDAETAFVALSLFNLLRSPFILIPFAGIECVQALVSIKRLNKFINLEELDPQNVICEERGVGDPLVMERCNFSWDNNGEIILKQISLRIKEGSLVAVVGVVGSGKSSLLSAFLGEMVKISGRVITKGTIAYVPQQAWIRNATLKDNILFGNYCNDFLYERAVSVCALKQDFSILPANDKTEIGERGINLSGGQKQRVSLARAIYSQADIYLMDDPLSAVDSHIGRHIFEEAFGPRGILNKKTRIWTTNSLTFLPSVDLIVVLKNGVISEIGTYTNLMKGQGDFKDFVFSHIQGTVYKDDFKRKFALKRKFMNSYPGLDQIMSQNHLSKSLSVENINPEPPSKRWLSTASFHCSNKALSSSITDEYKLSEKIIDEEKAEFGLIKWSVYKSYFECIGPWFYISSCISYIIFELFSVGSNIWLSLWTTDLELYRNGTINSSRRDAYIGVYGLLGLCCGAISVISDILPTLGCWWGAVLLHKRLLNSVFRLPISFFDSNPSGRILSRFSKDIDILDNILPRYIADVGFGSSDVIGSIVVICFTVPYFIIVIIPLLFLYITIQRYFISTLRQLNRLISISRSPIYSHFSETITGASSIRAFKAQNRFINEMEERIDLNVMCTYPSFIGQRWALVRMELIASLAVFFTALFIVINRDWINPGLAGLALNYAFLLTELLTFTIKVYSETEVNIVAVERIKEYIDATKEPPWEVEGNKVSSEWPEKGKIEFNNFSVRYREGLDCVLRNVTFSINGGEKVGVVGRTGAGKSSLTLSLFRIIEAAGGSIVIDGVDISKLGLQTLRSRLTIIPQDPTLFCGTVRLNLDPYGKHSDDQLWKCLEQSYLKDFFSTQPAGLQYEIGESGGNLSVGQKQLMCLARALLRKSKILVLDEATASVDLETDDLIQKTIRTEFAECTVITIAHRINTIMDADLVMVLDNGNLVEFDIPDHLLRNRNSSFFYLAYKAGLIY